MPHTRSRLWTWTPIAIGGLLALSTTMPLRADNLPLERIKMPPGFEIEVYARVPNARSLELG